MRKAMLLAIVLTVALVATMAANVSAKSEPIEFGRARMIIEVNGTDGDAGFQVFLDGEAWRKVKVNNPDGRTILDVKGKSAVNDFGLTELFSESKEPPFDEMPLDEFLALFPSGEYEFSGTTVEGVAMIGSATFTHAIPDKPTVIEPAGGAVLPTDAVVISWDPVADPPGSQIVGYEVIVAQEEPVPRVFKTDLPTSKSTMPVPEEFLEDGTEYKFEVLAIEASGNQTITEGAFETE
jgi:hypothetical protein